MSKKKTPEIITVDAAQVQELLAQLQRHLPEPVFESAAAMLRTLQWVMELIQKKNASLGRLRRILFGDKTEKTKNLFAGNGAAGVAAKERKPVKGHGRNGANQYSGAQRVDVSHPKLKPGEGCPACEKGNLIERAPSRIVRIVAQPMFHATIFALQVLRCSLCGKTYTSPPPAAAGTAKYDPKVGPMIAMMRFGGGMPHYRMEKMQKDLGVPLPAATQWELMEESARNLEPVHQELIRVAAQGQLLHNDDTTMRIQSLKKERAQSGSGRTGIFTTSIISKIQDHHIALYFTGGNHAGENLGEVLKHRAAGLDKPIHMCDGLSRNLPREFDALLAHCIPHGRRNFVDVKESFPEQCRKVLEDLSLVFKNDAQAKQEELSPLDRLRLHQERSAPILEGLRSWMQEQLDQKKVEPNSGLGEAIRYMFNHWEPLTLFLREPGAPLDNNICERALKLAILHRKNSLGYKTQNGARIGDLFMSLIHTCRLATVNPFDYLTTLVAHAQSVRNAPDQWLPWSYRQTLATAIG
jgi:transposase